MKAANLVVSQSGKILRKQLRDRAQSEVAGQSSKI
jgi:acyl-coenzyme A synthetase/AMP-(fatty) acid ligase